MARLAASQRAQLPDRAFAYVDAAGKRLLPIYDEPHVRAALARFNQVAFEDDAARDRARTRLLNAAKKFGIVPVGFISAQLRSERAAALPAGAAAALPAGFVTLLMTDIEASSALVEHLGEGYGALLEDLRTLLRRAAEEAGGHVVEIRADEFFGVFAEPGAALRMAGAVQRDLGARRFVGDTQARIRIGIHSGYPTPAEANYIGLAVHLASRVCDAGHGGQIVVTADTRTALEGIYPDGLRLRSLGEHRLRGIPAPVVLYQVTGKGLTSRFPPLRLQKRTAHKGEVATTQGS